MTHQEEFIKTANKLKIAADFEVPDGLLMPCGNQVLIKRTGQDAFISPGGIIMPESSEKKKGVHGLVMGIGPLVDLNAYPLRVGMKVEFRYGLEEDTLHKGIAYLLIDQFNIKGIVPPENYKYPKYQTNEEIRREGRQDTTKRIIDKSKRKFDEINNT